MVVTSVLRSPALAIGMIEDRFTDLFRQNIESIALVKYVSIIPEYNDLS